LDPTEVGGSLEQDMRDWVEGWNRWIDGITPFIPMKFG